MPTHAKKDVAMLFILTPANLTSGNVTNVLTAQVDVELDPSLDQRLDDLLLLVASQVAR